MYDFDDSSDANERPDDYNVFEERQLDLDHELDEDGFKLCDLCERPLDPDGFCPECDYDAIVLRAVGRGLRDLAPERGDD